MTGSWQISGRTGVQRVIRSQRSRVTGGQGLREREREGGRNRDSMKHSFFVGLDSFLRHHSHIIERKKGRRMRRADKGGGQIWETHKMSTEF